MPTTICTDCGTELDLGSDTVHETWRNNALCDACSEENNYVRDDDCGLYVRRSDLVDCHDCEMYVCPRCSEDYHRHDPSTTPNDIPNTGVNTTPQVGESLGPLDQAFLTGCEIEAQGTPGETQYTMLGELPDEFGIAFDGTVREGKEVLIPPSTGEAYAENVTTACEVMRDGGFFVEGTGAGFHVHVSFPEDKDALLRLMRTVYACEDMIYWLTDPERAMNPRYAHPLRSTYPFSLRVENEYELVYLNREGTSDVNRYLGHGARYLGLNMSSLWNHGTVEFRYFGGSLDPEEIIGWTRVVHSLINYSLSKFRVSSVLDLVSTPNLEEGETPTAKAEMMAKELGWSPDLREWVEDRMLDDWDSVDWEYMVEMLEGQDRKPAGLVIDRNRLSDEWGDTLEDEINALTRHINEGMWGSAAATVRSIREHGREVARARLMWDPDHNEELGSYEERRRRVRLLLNDIGQSVLSGIEEASDGNQERARRLLDQLSRGLEREVEAGFESSEREEDGDDGLGIGRVRLV